MIPTLSSWSSPPNRPKLADGEVHLWRFRLDLPTDESSELLQLLSADERLRAERLLDRAKAEQFASARARLRQILARYLNLKPENLAFSTAEHGKPQLAKTSGQSLAFNLAHAGHWGVLIITSGSGVGVDIEWVDPQLDYMKIMAGFFTPDEIHELENIPSARQRRGFYRIWTRKEAFLKAEGFGFSSPRSIQHNNRWMIRSFSIARHYLGAVAAPKGITGIQRWDFR